MADKVGDEFLVNSTKLGSQISPSAAALSDGGFVAIWEDASLLGGDLSSPDIRGQVFNADGTARGDEFLVNTTTLSLQLSPSVTGLSNGGFVATWFDLSQTGSDTSNSAIRAQAYNADGTARGDEFLVNTTTEQGQGAPSVTGLSDGGFVAIWMDGSQTGGDTTNSAIRGQAYNADGTARGDEFLVNTTTEGAQRLPSVAGLGDGGFVTTWEDRSKTDGDTNFGNIRGQIYTRDGTARGDEVLVNTTTVSTQTVPSVAGLSDGGFIATWTDRSKTGGDTSGTAIRGQVYNADGTVRADEILVNTTTNSIQNFPSVTGLSDGGFVATWTDSSQNTGDTSRTAVQGQVYDADGTRRGDDFLVNTTTQGFQSDPSVTGLLGGDFVATWTDNSETGGDQSGSAVRGQIFSLDLSITNEAPAARLDSAQTAPNSAVTINALANDSDPDGDDLTITDVGVPANGKAETTDDGRIVFTPDAGFTGTESFTYTVGDGNGGTDSGEVTVSVEQFAFFDLSASDQVTAVYVGYFGRAPDLDGRNFWVTDLTQDVSQGQSPAATAEEMASGFRFSEEAQSLFPFLDPSVSTDATESQIERFLNDLFNNLFNRDLGPAGTEFWVGEIDGRLESGQNIGDIIVDVMAGAGGVDVTTLQNKIKVAKAYTDNVTRFEVEESIQIIGAVDKSEESVEQALGQIG